MATGLIQRVEILDYAFIVIMVMMEYLNYELYGKQNYSSSKS